MVREDQKRILKEKQLMLGIVEMKTLKFNFISDLHLDFYVHWGGMDTLDQIEKFIDGIMPDDKADVLIVPGDIANNNYLIDAFFVEMCKRYDKIIWTLGNHEFYIVPKQRPTSLERVDLLDEMVAKHCGDQVVRLKGQIIEIDGFKIGGTHMWYDGSYAKNNFDWSDDQVYVLWKQFMNDYFQTTIDPFKHGLIDIEKSKLRAIYKELDLVVTHVAPIISPSLPVEWQNPSTGFFSFDGTEFMDGPAKAWLFGHTHKSYCFTNCDKDFLCNPMGYPTEMPNAKIQTWTLGGK